MWTTRSQQFLRRGSPGRMGWANLGTGVGQRGAALTYIQPARTFFVSVKRASVSLSTSAGLRVQDLHLLWQGLFSSLLCWSSLRPILWTVFFFVDFTKFWPSSTKLVPKLWRALTRSIFFFVDQLRPSWFLYCEEIKLRKAQVALIYKERRHGMDQIVSEDLNTFFTFLLTVDTFSSTVSWNWTTWRWSVL